MKFITTLIFSFILFSCKSKKDNQIDQPKKIDSASLNDINSYLPIIDPLKEISEKYKANTTFKDSRSNLLLTYQEILKENKNVILDRFRIKDVSKSDTHYLVLIEIIQGHKFIEFKCDSLKLVKLSPDIFNSDYRPTTIRNKYLILKINSVKKGNLLESSRNQIEGDVVASRRGEQITSDILYCKADFIDAVYK